MNDFDTTRNRVIRDLLAIIDRSAEPHSPPAFARAGQPIGLAFLDSAISLNHVLRESEELVSDDQRFLGRSVSIDLSLDRLTSAQRAAGRRYGELRAGYSDRTTTKQDPNTRAATPKVSESPLIWVPVTSLDRSITAPVDLRDSRGQIVPRATQNDLYQLVNAAFYQLFRHLLALRSPTEPTIREFRFGSNRTPRWLVQFAIAELLRDGLGCHGTIDLARIREAIDSDDNSNHSKACGLVLDHLGGSLYWDPFVQLLAKAANEYMIVGGLPADYPEHRLTYRTPDLPAFTPLRRKFPLIPWRIGDEHLISYERQLPYSLREFHLTLKAEEGVNVRRALLVSDRDRDELDLLTEDLAFLGGLLEHPEEDETLIAYEALHHLLRAQRIVRSRLRECSQLHDSIEQAGRPRQRGKLHSWVNRLVDRGRLSGRTRRMARLKRLEAELERQITDYKSLSPKDVHKLTTHLSAYAIHAGVVTSDDARDNYAHAYLSNYGHARLRPNHAAGSHTVRFTALLADVRPSLLHQFRWLNLALLITTTLIGRALTGTYRHLPWSELLGSRVYSPAIEFSWFPDRLSQYVNSGGRYGTQSLESINAIVAVVLVVLGLGLSRLELPKGRSILVRLRQPGLILVASVTAIQAYLLIAIAGSDDAHGFSRQLDQAMWGLLALAVVAEFMYRMNVLWSWWSRMNMFTAPVWLKFVRYLPSWALLYAPTYRLSKLLPLDTPHQIFGQFDSQIASRRRRPGRHSGGWHLLAQQRLRRLGRELRGNPSTDIRQPPGPGNQIVLQGETSVRADRGLTEYHAISAANRADELSNQIELLPRAWSHVLFGALVAVIITVLGGIFVESPATLGAVLITSWCLSVLILSLWSPHLETARPETSTAGRAAELASSASAALSADASFIAIDVFLQREAQGAFEMPIIKPLEIGTTTGSTDGRIIATSRLVALGHLAERTSTEEQDSQRTYSFIANPGFLYDNAKFVEMYIGLPEEKSRLRPDGLAVPELLILTETAEHVANVAQSLQGAILFMESPASHPSNWPQRHVAPNGHVAVRRLMHYGIRVRVALPQRSVVYRHRFRSEILKYAAQNGLEVFIQDRRQAAGHSWTKLADDSSAFTPQLNAIGRHDEAVTHCIPVTAVGQARPGCTYRLVNYVRATGCFLAGISVKALSDHAVITLWIPAARSVDIVNRLRTCQDYHIRHIVVGNSDNAESAPRPEFAHGDKTDDFEVVLRRVSMPSFLDVRLGSDGNLDGFNVTVWPAVASNWANFDVEKRVALWAIWDVARASFSEDEIVKELGEAWIQNLQGDAVAPTVEYSISRVVGGSRRVGRLKLSVPASFDDQRGADYICRSVENDWRNRLAQLSDDYSAEVQLTWREENLGRWANLR